MARAQRSTKRLASLAVMASCQYGSPKRSAKRSPTSAAETVGSMQVRPWYACCVIARATGSGAWPNMAPVSPRQKSA
jgi:hypothetical protein